MKMVPAIGGSALVSDHSIRRQKLLRCNIMDLRAISGFRSIADEDFSNSPLTAKGMRDYTTVIGDAHRGAPKIVL